MDENSKLSDIGSGDIGVRPQAQRRTRRDYKARYLTMRGYVVLLATALAAVIMAAIGFFAGAR